MVRTVVYAEDEIENSPLGEWNMTADGTPFMRQLTTNYQNPEPHWPFWPYRTTLIRKHQKERTWTVVELARRFKRMRQPFGMIDQFLLTVGFEDECETLTLLGVEEQNLTQLGLVAVGEDGDEIRDAEELVVTGLRDEHSLLFLRKLQQVPRYLMYFHQMMVDNTKKYQRWKQVTRFRQLQKFDLRWMMRSWKSMRISQSHRHLR